MEPTADTGCLVVTCPDRPGIVAAVSRFLAARGANIAQSDQYSTDARGGTFFLRMLFHLGGFEDARASLEAEFAQEVGAPFAMEWRLTSPSRPKRVGIMVSREDHCLVDLLWRHRRGELRVEVPLVLSNHEDLRPEAERFGVPYEVVPVAPDAKPVAEARQLELLHGARVDLVVLARYMQIVSGDFLERLGVPVINIHHSFLPAFVGAKPYHQAYERGVKLIGATAHYATSELDQGPIIHQEVTPVSHRHEVADLIRLGTDLEKSVLARAVRLHLEHRVLAYGNRTVVFD